MKPWWIRFLLFLLCLLFLNACVDSGFNKKEAADLETYPSQFLVGDVYVLKNNEEIDGNIAGIGTTLVIEDGASVLGDISLLGSQMEISGNVTGDINLFAGTTFVHSTAVIDGAINQITHQIKIKPGAQISGEINTFTIPTWMTSQDSQGLGRIISWLKPTGWIIYQLVRNLVLVFLNILIIFLFKKQTMRISNSINKNIAVSWGIGLLVMIAAPLVSLVLVITVCLSPIGLLIILFFLAADIWGWGGVSFIVGGKLTHWLKLDWPEEAEIAVGTLLLGFVSTLLALLPIISITVNLMISAIGLGGVLLSKFGTADQNK